MRRTQLYIEDDLWRALHAQARRGKTSISNLVRIAAREHYLRDSTSRREALLGIAGIWKHREDLPETSTFVRSMRKGTRLKRLGAL